jgi:hypothetical protein
MLFAGGLNVKLLLVGGLLGLITAVALTVVYFSLGKFFAASARALNRNQRREPQQTQPLQMMEAASEKIEHNTAKAGS